MRPLPPIVAVTVLAAAAVAGAAAPDRGFADGATATAVAIESREGRAFVVVHAGAGTLALLVDPAATNLMSPAAARRLGLAATAAAEAPILRLPELALGAYRLRELPFFVADLGRWPATEGVAVDGVLGAEAFEQVVLTIDHGAQRLTLTERAAFAPGAEAVTLPLRFLDRQPLVAASVDGRAGEFALEPGSRVPLTLHARFVREHDLLDRYRHGHEGVVGWGLAGPQRGRATRVGAVALGGASATGVVASLQVEDAGSGGLRETAGRIGGGLLARFVASYDLAGRALTLLPRADAAPDAHDRSGMWLNLDADDLIIDALVPNGPAARSQLQPHDRIVAVDGVPATQLTLAGLRRKLAESPAGARVKVTARRDGKVVYATLVLADLVPPAAPIPRPTLE